MTELNIVCFGDSNTWGYDPRSFLGDRYPEQFRWPELMAEKLSCTVINMGLNGREIPADCFVPPENTDLLLVMLGTNDLLQGLCAAEAGIRMEKFLTSIPFPARKILLIVPPAMKSGEWVQEHQLIDESILLSEVYRKVAESLGVHLVNTHNWNIPLSYDGVHFTESGHSIFGDHISSFLSRL